jgi:hypothetical protein
MVGGGLVKRITSLFTSVFNTTIAISAAALVLLGYFLPIQPFGGIRMILMEWAVILAGLAVLFGIGNLFYVHLQKVRERSKGYLYSLVLLVSFLSTIFVGILGLNAATFFVVDTIVIPSEISLMAVLAVTLPYALVRMLRGNLNILSILFFIVVFITILVTTPWPTGGDVRVAMDTIRAVLTQVLASGGARGILLGVALGTLTTGLRLLFGADRPYGGK